MIGGLSETKDPKVTRMFNLLGRMTPKEEDEAGDIPKTKKKGWIRCCRLYSEYNST